MSENKELNKQIEELRDRVDKLETALETHKHKPA
jgi:hypothetical protein